MKSLLILALFAAVALLVYWRLRPCIRGVRRFVGVLREVKRMRDGAAPAGFPQQQPSPKKAANEKLQRCAACGTWMPADRAVTLRATGVSYCSHACLERSADSPRRKAASASRVKTKTSFTVAPSRRSSSVRAARAGSPARGSRR